jgi:hypothetical protein
MAYTVRHWHGVILKAGLQDYSAVDESGGMATPQQPSVTYGTRAATIAHLALYDSYTGITQEGSTYLTYETRPQIGVPSHLFFLVSKSRVDLYIESLFMIAAHLHPLSSHQSPASRKKAARTVTPG